jgi:type VI secretion system protein ImpF
MADRTLSERLQPSLLDRLTDTEPGAVTESREARVIDMRRLREIVQRDLSWLLNTSNNEVRIDPTRYPNAAASVLNYGIREVAGDFSNVERAQKIRASIARAIARFEPRIDAGTLDVTLHEEADRSRTLVSFDIRADMWALPLPMELFLRSEVDLTTGELKLERKS